MNKRQVIILWVIAIALGAAVAAVKLGQDKTVHSATRRAPGDTLFEKFPASEVAAIRISGPEDSVNLAKKDGKWVVSDRGDFPANADYVNNLLRTLGDLKVTQGMQAGASFAPRFGMDESATLPAEHGLIATFQDEAGKEIAKVGLGKNIESGASPNPMMGGGSVGRYVRNYGDDSGFYAVGEMFPSVAAEPARWLSEGFISPEKIETVAVSQPGGGDIAWKLTREGEEAEFKLAGTTAGEVADNSKTAAFKSLFSYARFDDVVPADKVAEKIDTDRQRTATIVTFEGFTYEITLAPEKSAEKTTPPIVQGEAQSDDKFLMTVAVSATLPKERKKEDGEKPEDAAAKDKAFTERLKTLTEKLEREKAFAGRTFEIGKSQVQPLLEKRQDLVTKAKPPAPDAAAMGSVQPMPGGMIARPPVTATTPPIEAVTPPIQVPAANEEAAPTKEVEAPLEIEPLPTNLEETPPTIEEAPAKVEEAPAKVEEAPAKVEEAPAKVEEAPAKVEEAPAKVEEAPAQVEEAPAKVEEAPAKVEEAPAKVEEAPAKVEEAPAKVEEAPAKAGDGASGLEGDPEPAGQ